MKRWIHAKSEITNFPETISILLYPTTDTWITYTKDYEHEGGGCYYHTKDISNPVLSSFVSLYPDGSLTYLWEGVEKPLNHEWREVGETGKVCAKLDKKRDIQSRIRSYIAAQARDDVKNGSPVATYDKFEDEMKDLGFKSSRDKYDYYIACYNSANEKNKQHLRKHLRMMKFPVKEKTKCQYTKQKVEGTNGATPVKFTTARELKKKLKNKAQLLK